MKAIIIRARDNWKAGEEIEVNASEFALLSEEGVAVTKSQYDAEQSIKARDRKSIEQAVVRAKARNAVAPKDETVLATALGRFDQGKADAEVLVEFIDGIRATETTNSEPSGYTQRTINGGENTPVKVQVIRASLEDASQGVIKATEPQNALIRAGNFAEAQRLAKEASVIIKANHLQMFADGSDFLLRDTVKAATFSDPNSQVGALAGDLILVRNLGFLKNKLPWLGKLTTDLSSEPAKFGQAILTRYITPPGVLTWVPGVGFTSDATAIAAAGTGTTQSGGTTQASGTVTKSVPSTTDKSVILNMFKATEIEFPVSLLSGTVRNLFAEQYSAQTYSLAENINSDVLAGIFAATWSGIKTSYVKALANWNLSGMIGVKNAMTISKIPDVGRFALLHSFYHDKLLEDSNLLSAKAIMALIHKDESEFNTGEIPTLFGVKPLESQLASATSAGALTTWTDDTDPGTTNIVGFAGNMSSYMFVSRPPQDYTSVLNQLGIPATASIRLVTEPDSGLTVMVFSYADNGKMSVSQRVCVMWGKAQGDPRVGFPIKLAA